MEKQRTNNGPLKESADKHSISQNLDRSSGRLGIQNKYVVGHKRVQGDEISRPDMGYIPGLLTTVVGDTADVERKP